MMNAFRRGSTRPCTIHPRFALGCLRKANLLSASSRGANGGIAIAKRTCTDNEQAQWQAEREERTAALLAQLEASWDSENYSRPFLHHYVRRWSITNVAALTGTSAA